MAHVPGEPALAGPQVDAAPASAVRDLYVVGGQQRKLRPVRAHFGDWYEYQKGVALRMDTATGKSRTMVEYESPEGSAPAVDPAIIFKSGTRVGDRLYLCTQTEVMVYRLPDFTLETYLSLPCFNDVHHVRPTPDGNLLVAVTGLDMVIEVTTAGQIVHEWNVFEPSKSPFGERFSRDVDYRLIATTKPHLAHPNHVFYLGEEPWATRFQQQDAVSLTDPTRRMEIGLERLHDGIVFGDRVMFTTVDARIAVVDARTLKLTEVIDLREMHKPDLLLGWCRGLFLDGDRLWVGFSRMRPTKFRENVAWLKNGFRHSLGTHVALYDLAKRECLAQIDVEAFGLNAIFGVYSAE